MHTQTQAVLLLTAWFSRPGPTDPKPLTPTEWGRFAQWLHAQGAAPETLLTCNDPRQVLTGWSDKTVTPERVKALLARSAALGLAFERWQRAGLWVMIRSDEDYPTRLKKLLGHSAPPLFFGCGNRLLLDKGGIAVVGSRDADDTDLACASELGRVFARQGRSVVSGGARGVDEAAMLGALAAGGTAIGVLADSLLRSTTSARYRSALIAQDLVLVSTVYPEATFNVGNAMARNRYVYCLSDAAIVVTSRNSGGTWNGAIEDLKHRWVPLWVKREVDPNSGNAALVDRGGRWLPEEHRDLELLTKPDGYAEPVSAMAPLLGIGSTSQSISQHVAENASSTDYMRGGASSVPDPEHLDTYEHFVRKLETLFPSDPFTAKAAQEKLEIDKDQLSTWLARAVAEGVVAKFARPTRYQLSSLRQGRLDL